LALLVAPVYSQNPTFRAKSPLVVVPVSVRDNKHLSIDGLTVSDFVLLDNGTPRSIQVDPSGVYQSGISALIVVETGAAAHAALLKIKKTGSLIDGYITGADGDAALLTAGSDVKVAQPFTPDGLQMRAVFRSLKANAGNDSHILDAIRQGLDMLAAKPSDRRRILILISESRDRGSKTKPQEVLDMAQRSNVTIYTVTYSAYLTPFTTKATDLGTPADAGINPLTWVAEMSRLAKENIGEALAVSTGGRHLSFRTLHSLEDDMTSIGKELHSQYLVSFTPPFETIPTYHSLQISVKTHPNAVIHSRPGYWTTPAAK
jgi:VWFA-related protein